MSGGIKKDVASVSPGEEVTNAKPEEKMDSTVDTSGAMKKGGKVAKRKKGGAVGGDKPAARLDKPARARGGRMTPSSPMSGASAPNLGYAKK